MIKQIDPDVIHLIFGTGDLLQSVATAKTPPGEPQWWVTEHTPGPVGVGVKNLSQADLLKSARVTMSFATPQSIDVLVHRLTTVKKIQFPTPPKAPAPPAGTSGGEKIGEPVNESIG